MCDGWWEERHLEERFRLAKEEADKIRRLTENLVPPGKPEQQPERQPQTQPDAVPV